ncbi:MAG TPA: pyridoxamine 5'-phosphate oxidase [Actinomycetota bacterium]|jgi:hypothetical protein
MRWGEFALAQPDLAEAGRALLYQHGVGLGFLATTRADGGPRVHPMCPLLTDEDLYAFIVPSPKRLDLHRDGRYALHSFPVERNEDAFSLTGRAAPTSDGAAVEALAAQFAVERNMPEPPAEIGSWELFVFDVDSVLLTRTTGHGDPAPNHTVWHARSG